MDAHVGYADHIFITQAFFKNWILYVKKTYKRFYLLSPKGAWGGWYGVGIGNKKS